MSLIPRGPLQTTVNEPSGGSTLPEGTLLKGSLEYQEHGEDGELPGSTMVIILPEEVPIPEWTDSPTCVVSRVGG